MQAACANDHDPEEWPERRQFETPWQPSDTCAHGQEEYGSDARW